MPKFVCSHLKVTKLIQQGKLSSITGVVEGAWLPDEDNQSYSECLCVQLLSKLPENTYIKLI